MYTDAQHLLVRMNCGLFGRPVPADLASAPLHFAPPPPEKPAKGPAAVLLLAVLITRGTLGRAHRNASSMNVRHAALTLQTPQFGRALIVILEKLTLLAFHSIPYVCSRRLLLLLRSKSPFRPSHDVDQEARTNTDRSFLPSEYEFAEGLSWAAGYSSLILPLRPRL